MLQPVAVFVGEGEGVEHIPMADGDALQAQRRYGDVAIALSLGGAAKGADLHHRVLQQLEESCMSNRWTKHSERDCIQLEGTRESRRPFSLEFFKCYRDEIASMLCARCMLWMDT